MWSESSTAAKPNGSCYRCGGTLYENLVHHCSTSVLPVFTATTAKRSSQDSELDVLRVRVGVLEGALRELADTAASATCEPRRFQTNADWFGAAVAG